MDAIWLHDLNCWCNYYTYTELAAVLQLLTQCRRVHIFLKIITYVDQCPLASYVSLATLPNSLNIDMGSQIFNGILGFIIGLSDSLFLLLFFLSLLGISVICVLVVLGPSALLLKSVRHNSETISLWGKIGRFIGALAWPPFVMGVLVSLLIYSFESPDNDVANYDSAIESFDHVDHFPDEVSEENVHHFYGRRDSRGLGSSCHHIPPGNTVFLSLDLSPQEAEAVFQQADRQASHVVAYTDSTSTILEHRFGPEPSEAPLDFTAGRRAPVDQADYVAYFFESAPDSIRRANRSDTVAVDDTPGQSHLISTGEDLQ